MAASSETNVIDMLLFDDPPPSSPPSRPPLFSRLPLEVFRKITDHLDYTSHLIFSTLSKDIYNLRKPRILPGRTSWYALNLSYRQFSESNFPLLNVPIHCPTCDRTKNNQVWCGYYNYGGGTYNEDSLFIRDAYLDQRIGVVFFDECQGMWFRIPSQMLWSWQCHRCTQALDYWGLGGRAQPKDEAGKREVVMALGRGAFWGDSDDPKTFDPMKHGKHYFGRN